MRIGLSYNLKDDFILKAHHPPDELEEYDCEETISALESAITKMGHQVATVGWVPSFGTQQNQIIVGLDKAQPNLPETAGEGGLGKTQLLC